MKYNRDWNNVNSIEILIHGLVMGTINKLPGISGGLYSLIIGFCILDKKMNYTFNLEYLEIEDNIEQKEDIIVKVNERYVNKLEKIILKYPEQYFWFHKKWDKNIYV